MVEALIIVGILLLLAAVVWTWRGERAVDEPAHVESGHSHLRDRE